MEWRVDLAGDTSAAERGAAALRAEGEAARDLAKALTGVAKAREEAGKRRPDAPAKEPREPKPPESPKSPWSDAEWKAGPKKSGPDLSTGMAEAAREQAAGKGALAAKKASDAQLQALRGISSGTKELIATQGKATTDLLKYGAALAGVGSLGDLSKIAVGWRNMAALQMISMRATQDVRRLFTGLDSTPLVRAASALERNLSKSTVTGNALSGILQRGFGAAFNVLEKVEPLISAFGQGIVLGALKAEEGLYKLEAAFAPQVVALEDFAASEGALEDAALAGTVALGGLAVVGAIAAAPFVAAGAAVTLLVDQIRKLKSELGTGLEGLAAMKKHLFQGGGAMGVVEGIAHVEGKAGRAARGDAEKDVQSQGASGYEAAQARFAAERAAAEQTGKDIANGLVKGIDAGAPAVKAAGARAAAGAVAGARDAAGAHSPAEKTIRLGRDLDAGAVVGMDRDAGAVRAAAQRSLVPDVAPGAGRGSGGAAPAPSLGSVTMNLVFPGITSGTRESLAQAAEPLREGLRSACIRLGLPIPASA